MGRRGYRSLFLILPLLVIWTTSAMEGSTTGRSGRTPRDVRSRSALCDGKEDNVLYPDPIDCRRYILCTGNYEYIADCPQGLFYDPELQACNFDDDGACEAELIRRATIKKVTSFDITSGLTRIGNLRTQPTLDTSATASRDTFCLNRADGTYADDTNCFAYLTCSNGLLHVNDCPNGLIYRTETSGCDFDREGRCSNGKTSGAQLNTIPQPQNDLASRAQEMMPAAVEKAMSALMDQLKDEAELANRPTNNGDRPFRLVQRLQKGKPIVKQMSMNAFILTNAVNEVLEQLGMASGASSMQLLENVPSPLSPNTARIMADDKIPAADPGTCPYPAYTCSLSEYRSFDGSCNNLQNPIWGRALTPLLRNLPPVYDDGMNTFRKATDGAELPGARAISSRSLPDKNLPHHIHTVMVMQWGQFIDHDFSLTAISKVPEKPSGAGKTKDIECGDDGCTLVHEACVPIPVPTNDPDFSGSNRKCLEFVRSEPVPSINCKIGPREQLNMLTSYIDASMIYGSTKEEADSLRDTSDPGRGKLLVGPHPLGTNRKGFLPTGADDDKCLERQSTCYLAGDERVNEQTALTALHVIWLREHNRIENELYKVNPHWDGDKLFQETRKILAAYMQVINYAEFLPVVLGPVVMEKYGLTLLTEGFYTGYDSTVNAGASNVFTTAAFRFGHSMLTPTFKRQDANYEDLASIQLSEMFFKPSRMLDAGSGGMDGFLRGMCNTRIQRVDKFITKEVTKNLFSKDPPNLPGADLASLNIQRARDHGLQGYNGWRVWCGLSKASTFEDLATEIPDATTRNAFRELYKSVDDVDLFPAALAETPLEGSLLGPTFSCILGREFARLRKGDRFWHENQDQFTTDQLADIRQIRLSKILCINGDNITTIQPSVMELPFRVAYPDPAVFTEPMNGLPPEWLRQLWDDDYNKRQDCFSLPDIDYSKWKDHKPDTLSPEWFARLWGDDHNARVHCDCLRDVDFSKWKQ